MHDFVARLCGIIGIVLILLSSLFTVSRCDTLMYPFDSSQGDAVMNSTDDYGDGPMQLSIDFPFYNTTYNLLYVSLSALQFLLTN
jgi:hypothetical protein